MTSVATRRFNLAGMLADAARLLAIVLFIPFAILAVGTPSLVIAGLLWLARIARAAL